VQSGAELLCKSAKVRDNDSGGGVEAPGGGWREYLIQSSAQLSIFQGDTMS